MAGEYRQLLKGTEYEDVRLALTHRPIVGMIERPDLIKPMLELFDSLEGPVAKKYADMLRAGGCMPVAYTNPDGTTKIFGPGELFLRS